MITYKQVRTGLAVSGLMVLLVTALMVRQSDAFSKQETIGQSLAPCCMEQEAVLSSRWYLQCDPEAYYTDWQLLM